MTTEEFNIERSATWIQKFNKDESRLFIMIGIKENGAFSFMADTSLTPEKIAKHLEDLAQAIRTRNENNKVS